MPLTITPKQEAAAPASAEQPVTPSPVTGAEAGAQSQAQAQSPDIAPIVEAAVAKALDAVKRAEQSQRDRMEARIKTQFDQMQQAMTAAGVTLTPDQARAAQERIRAAAAQEELPPGSAQQQDPRSQAQTQQPAATQPTNPLDTLAERIMTAAGLEIDDSDPEAKTVDWTNEATVAATLTQALAEKRRRQALGQNPLTGGGAAGSNPIASITDTDALWRKARGR